MTILTTVRVPLLSGCEWLFLLTHSSSEILYRNFSGLFFALVNARLLLSRIFSQPKLNFRRNEMFIIKFSIIKVGILTAWHFLGSEKLNQWKIAYSRFQFRFGMSYKNTIVSKLYSWLDFACAWFLHSNFRFHAYSPEASVPKPNFPFHLVESWIIVV